MFYKNCFEPKLWTTNFGEICEPDEPRTKDGWLVNMNFGWEKPKKSRQTKNWKGCVQCWNLFCTENSEYKIK